ncbi:hypothetical protein AB0N88_20605 [Streptomyces sp. NPDC093516]|uniref:hypothetical protein n=1 Tax=Streptomyces sp. NPDC093516 TaxID=3155304 RepID=UPI003411FE19
MHVLVPDDPVFFAQFQSLEEPLLRHLYRLHGAGTESDDERLIANAYDSWVQVLLKLPLWSHWHSSDETEPDGSSSADAESADCCRYALYSACGQQLTSLYPVEVAASDLGNLTACLDLFAEADHARRTLPHQPYNAPPAREEDLTPVLRRVLKVLLLPAPDGLLGVLRHVESQGRAFSVTLAGARETEYRRFCEDVVAILSSGDTFAYRHHRAMYF